MDITLGEIASLIGGKLMGDKNTIVSGISSLAEAGPKDISLYTSSKYRDALKRTKAAAILVKEKTDLFEGSQILVENPGLAQAKIAGLFIGGPHKFPGISEKAFVHKTARIGQGVSIYPFVYVGEDVELGDEVILFPGVFVGNRAKIGKGAVLYPHVIVMDDCVIGEKVILHPGVIIGADGFGFVPDGNKIEKIPQVGVVQIDRDVEIGANTCVDRASLGKTWVKEGVKTDNLVQIGHNVVIGEHSIIVAQAGIAGSVEVGKGVVIGGQVGISDHITIGDGAMIGSQSGIAKSVAPGEIVSGTPAMPHKMWLKTSLIVNKLPELYKQIRELQKRVAELEKQLEKE